MKRKLSDKPVPWWQEAVIYQIYPRSFNDSNGDGIGDIPGIIEKLDYLKELGVDALWLSPVFPSPMHDFGYDISNYCDIDPAFGTMKDLKRLVREAKRRKIKILFDIVVNHTSHEHPWFKESASSKDSSKRDWYIWKDGDKGVPNNWMAAFGGKAWELDESTNSYYYHAFLKEQPDLNWFNEEVRNAVYDVFRFWMDIGIAGFRLDVVNFYAKDRLFRNNPFTIGPSPRPYDMQKHLYDRDRPELYDFLKELRTVTDEYDDIMMVGETYTAPPGDQELAALCMGNGSDMLHMAFDFSLIFQGGWNSSLYSELIQGWYNAVPEKGWPSLVLSNHDQARIASRVGGGDRNTDRVKISAALLLLAKGTPFIYYGDELGMKNGSISRDEIMDPPGQKYWPFFKGRDPFRTPMMWDKSSNAGFTAGKPWLPVNREYQQVNVREQMNDSQSVYFLYKNLIALRRKNPALTRGEYIPIIEDEKDVLAFYRTTAEQTVAVFLNFSRRPRSIGRPMEGEWKTLFSNKEREKGVHGFNMTLAAYEIAVFEK